MCRKRKLHSRQLSEYYVDILKHMQCPSDVPCTAAYKAVVSYQSQLTTNGPFFVDSALYFSTLRWYESSMHSLET